jgi:hypothetical protein
VVFLLTRQVLGLRTVAFGCCFGAVCTGWRFLMNVIWQYAAFCLTALQQINTSDRNKAHFSNSALPFSIGVREVQPKMIRAYKQSFD